mmetsp:Transcript_21179/g.53850  ORF Transcript_21179/g.53850 Transcript_21179/m.53850 type:complete len:217 (-) Transcript_21179:594-1244(-)
MQPLRTDAPTTMTPAVRDMASFRCWRKAGGSCSGSAKGTLTEARERLTRDWYAAPLPALRSMVLTFRHAAATASGPSGRCTVGRLASEVSLLTLEASAREGVRLLEAPRWDALRLRMSVLYVISAAAPDDCSARPGRLSTAAAATWPRPCRALGRMDSRRGVASRNTASSISHSPPSVAAPSCCLMWCSTGGRAVCCFTSTSFCCCSGAFPTAANC